MNVEILSPDKQIFKGEADALQVPGLDGLLGILKNHAPLISALASGKVKVTSGGQDSFYEIKGGVIEVFKNKVIILAE